MFHKQQPSRNWRGICAVLVCAAVLFPAHSVAQLRSERRVVGDTTVVRTIGTEAAAATRTLQKVFSFGQLGGAPEYVFGRLSAVNLGPDGSVWIFDMSVPAMRVYDSTGKFLRQVGRGGQGPGEYGQLFALAALPGGAAVILDPSSSRLLRYDSMGVYTNYWTVPTSAASGLPRPSGVRLSMSGVIADTAGRIYARTTVGTRPPTPGDPRSEPIVGVIVGSDVLEGVGVRVVVRVGSDVASEPGMSKTKGWERVAGSLIARI
jgi:hypothetical protein